MNKYLNLAIFFNLFLNVALAQEKKCDTIVWTEKTQISWNDFQGKSDSTSEFDAISSCIFDYDFSYNSDSLFLSIFSGLNTCKSWTNTTRDSNLLKHERTHLDIVEYFKRLLIKALLESRFKKNDFHLTLKRIFDEIQTQKDDMELKYESETSFSRNELSQTKWSDKIRGFLVTLKIYNKTHLTFSFKE